MRLTGQIGRLSDDVVATLFDRSYCGRILKRDALNGIGLSLKIHNITDSDRIGCSASFQTDLSSKNGREKIPLRKSGKQIMASRMLYNCRLSFNRHIH